jgi:hypothetical protein
VREDIVGEAVRIVYQELRGELLMFASEVLQAYLTPASAPALASTLAPALALTDASFSIVVSVVTGVLWSLQTCSADLSRSATPSSSSSASSLPDVLADAVATTQYLVDLLWSIFRNTTSPITELSSEVSSLASAESLPQAPCQQQVFRQTEVINAVNLLLGSLSMWISEGKCVSMQGSGTVDVFDELGAECVEVRKCSLIVQ